MVQVVVERNGTELTQVLGDLLAAQVAAHQRDPERMLLARKLRMDGRQLVEHLVIVTRQTCHRLLQVTDRSTAICMLGVKGARARAGANARVAAPAASRPRSGRRPTVRSRSPARTSSRSRRCWRS